MSVKASFRYQEQAILLAAAWFYGILFAMKIVLTIFFAAMDVHGNTSGVELGSAFFLLVVGLATFTENFGMLLQNGVSRKTFFATRLLTFACTAALVAVVDRVIQPLMALMPTGGSIFGSKSFFEYLYPLEGAGGVFVCFVLAFCLNLFVLNVGACIVTVFYRLPKWAKPVVGAGVPVLLIMILPLVDSALFGGAVYSGVFTAVMVCFGFASGQPLLGVLSFLVLSAVFAVLGWLLTRRAIFRK